jgi:hypothetical protein
MQPEAVTQVLNDPLARKLLHSSIPVRMAYTGTDGGPRAVPMGFHWDGERIVMATAPASLKVRALSADPRVALTVDTNEQPPEILLIRGTATIEVVDGIPPEFLEASRKLVDAEQWEGYEAGVRAMYDRMAVIRVTPEWAKLLDFQTRVPEALVRLSEERQRG